MSRYRAVYDEKGLAYEIENGEVIFLREDLGRISDIATNSVPAVQGDLPDFVSPIDGSVVRGRSGLRDHCARHNVVPVADLQGLPPKPMNGNYSITQAERQEIKQMIAQIIDSNVDYRNSDWDK